ncbi:MAG TPA: pyridoxamine 5'-phosphate oxidase family protein, partial [Gemmatimonadales bacterium]|nr:pyridoxamine 5'-phosphate oxidase family protein [Gemmatimonadales bacterium]
MPRPLTELEREAFLADPHIAVLSLPSDDDRPPLAFPIWYGYQPGGEITYYTHRTEPKSRKLRLLHQGTAVSLCVQREELPYKYVTVEGTVVTVNEAPTAEQ